MVSNKRAEDCAKTLAQFCKERGGCQNCIFRAFGADRWAAHLRAYNCRANAPEQNKKHPNEVLP